MVELKIFRYLKRKFPCFFSENFIVVGNFWPLSSFFYFSIFFWYFISIKFFFSRSIVFCCCNFDFVVYPVLLSSIRFFFSEVSLRFLSLFIVTVSYCNSFFDVFRTNIHWYLLEGKNPTPPSLLYSLLHVISRS